jgi:hypothetical protein
MLRTLDIIQGQRAAESLADCQPDARLLFQKPRSSSQRQGLDYALAVDKVSDPMGSAAKLKLIKDFEKSKSCS